MAKDSALIIRIGGDTTGLGTAISEAQRQLGTLVQRVNSLQQAFSSAFKIGMGVGFTNFIKGTLREAVKEGSALQQSLGVGGVKAANELRDSLIGVRTAVQQTALSILGELTPALQKAAEWGKALRERLGGGLSGVGARVAEQRAGGALGQIGTAEGQISELRSQRAAVMREIQATNSDRGLMSFIDTLTGGNVRDNKVALLEAQLTTINLELGFFEAHLQDLNRMAGGSAMMGMIRRGAGLLRSATGFDAAAAGTAAGTRLSGGLIGFTGRNIWAQMQGMGGIAGGVLAAMGGAGQHNAGIARGIIENNMTPAERAQRELDELERLRNIGELNPQQFSRARGNILSQLRSMLPEAGISGPLGATESRFLTRGNDQQSRQLDAIERGNGILDGIKTLLDNEAKKQDLDVVVRRAR